MIDFFCCSYLNFCSVTRNKMWLKFTPHIYSADKAKMKTIFKKELNKSVVCLETRIFCSVSVFKSFKYQNSGAIHAIVYLAHSHVLCAGKHLKSNHNQTRIPNAAIV